MLLLDFGLSAADVVAACQQLAIVCGVYEDDRPAIEHMLDADGTILLWQRHTVSWPPAFSVIRTTAGHYFVTIEGTSNLNQAIIHDWGTFVRDDYFGATKCNGQWINVYVRLRDMVRDVIPKDLPAGRLHFSGHSYGGALAFLGALDFAATWGAGAAQCLTFGEPRSMEAGYSGVLPQCHWRFKSSGDPVPGLPPNGAEIAYLNALFPTRWTLTTAAWAQYGDVQTLYPGGTINQFEPPPDPLPAGVTLVPIEEHLPRNYWGRLKAWNERFGT